MKTYNFYESINCETSNKYDRYIRFVDPFYIRRLKNKFIKATNERYTHKLSNFVDSGDVYDDGFHEFKLSKELFNEVIKNDGIFNINRYIVEWKTKNYFLKKYNDCKIFLIDDDIIVFRINHYDVVHEYDLKLNPNKIKRELKLKRLIK